MEKTSSIFIFLVEREKWGQVEQKIWGGVLPRYLGHFKEAP